MLRLDLNDLNLSEEKRIKIEEMWRRCARRIILSTTLAGSGHPGGSLSSLHLLLVLYSVMKHDPQNPRMPERDRLLVSMGHISPAVYAVLSEFEYFSDERFLLEFRKAGSPYSGHVEQAVPGVEWNTGNLGQGLSSACGMALALKMKKQDNLVFTLMGDGEQQKGQLSEARRFAYKYGLNNLIGIVDRNHLQICGDTDQIMPQDISSEYRASGWNVLELENGHDVESILKVLSSIKKGEVKNPAAPSVIIARTIMGKGISFMENLCKYHGQALSAEEAGKALIELGFSNDLSLWLEKRKQNEILSRPLHHTPDFPAINYGTPILYEASKMTDNRSAYGSALFDLAQSNNKTGLAPKIVGFSCDLEGSVKMDKFHKQCPEAFFEAGIQEHHAAAMAGTLSCEGFSSFFSTFGVFAVDEVFNQHRLSDINNTSVKVVATHVGLDVGEDGPTHQCVDYVGLLNNLFDFSIFCPADPNQTDRIIRYIASTRGNHFVGMGRSKMPIVTDVEGNPFFGPDYRFQPGKADWIREGRDGYILSYGAMIPAVLSAVASLGEKYGLSVGLINMASLKPVDRQAVIRAAQTGTIITVEDHNIGTGLGSIVGNILAEENLDVSFVKLGVSKYGGSGKPADLYRMQGLDADSIASAVQRAIKKNETAAMC